VFTLTSPHLRRLCEVNAFPFRDDDDLVFFGLRGCLPLDVDEHSFGRSRGLALAGIDYTTPRCTLGQWRPSSGTLALFPGSTVPHRKYVQRSLPTAGRGANQMLTGYYDDYRKGRHRHGQATGHDAFRQTRGRPHRRTADDLDFENDDRVEFDNPFDNLHAAWCQGTEHGSYASAGCQVVVGFPCCAQLANAPNVGPWARFHDHAYEIEQDSFGYILLDGRSAQSVCESDGAKLSARLRYGSRGELVEELQEGLKRKGFYEGAVDGDFGPRTMRCVLEFQTAVFGPDADDGVVGPITASALAIAWPTV
jgi:hypothetical protein